MNVLILRYAQSVQLQALVSWVTDFPFRSRERLFTDFFH